MSCAADADPDAVGPSISRYLETRGQVTGTVYVRSISGAVETVQHLASLGTLLFFAVGGIALLVSLLGVFSSMLSAAHERTERDRHSAALGARKRDIRRIFLSEAVLLCAAGGAAGLALAWTALRLGAACCCPGWRLTAVLPLIAALCGGIAGLLPAVRAASMDPIEAMKITRTKQKKRKAAIWFPSSHFVFSDGYSLFAVKNRRGKRKMISPLLCTG